MTIGSSARFADSRDPNQRSDEELVRLARGGDDSAFGVLSDRYRKPLFNAAYRIVGSAEDAQDVAQESIVKALVNLSSFDESRRFFSWIYRIAVNEALDRAGRGRKFVDDQSEELLETTSTVGLETSTLEVLEEDESRRLVHAAIQELKPNDRAVLVLHYIAEMPYSQVAGTLDLPLEKVRSRLFTARRRLRMILEEKPGFDAVS